MRAKLTVNRAEGWHVWFVVVAVAALVGAAVANVPTRGRIMNVTGLLAVVTAVATVGPLLRRAITGRFDVLEPIVWANAMLFALFAVRPIIMLSTQNFSFQGTIDVQRGFPRAVILGTLGTISFVAAYELWPLVRTKATTVMRWKVSRSATTTAVYWLVGLGTVLYLARLASAGNPIATLKLLAAGRSAASASTNASAYLNDGPLLFAVAATVIVTARRAPPPQKERVGCIGLTLLAVFAFSLLGNRRLIIPSAATPLIAYGLVNFRRPKGATLAILLPVIFLALAIIPTERSSGARAQVQGGAAGIVERAFTQPFQPIGDFFSGVDTEMVPDLALEVQNLQQPSDYYYGKATVGDLFISPIPSALLPGKPQSARNGFLMRIFGAPCTVLSGQQCPDFSVIGTFYQDFWYFGAVAGMLLLGAFSSALWRRYWDQPGNRFAVALLASWTVSLPIIIRAGFMPPVQWWLEFILPTLLALRMSSVRETESGRLDAIMQRRPSQARSPDRGLV